MHHVSSKFTLACFILCLYAMQAIDRIDSFSIVVVYYSTKNTHRASFYTLPILFLKCSLLKTFYQPHARFFYSKILHFTYCSFGIKTSYEYTRVDWDLTFPCLCCDLRLCIMRCAKPDCRFLDALSNKVVSIP